MNAPFPLSEPRTLGLVPERLQRIGTALEAEIAAGTLPGAVLAIARHGKLAYLESFGHLDPATRMPMRNDALFSIASMTKPLVTVGALMLYVLFTLGGLAMLDATNEGACRGPT